MFCRPMVPMQGLDAGKHSNIMAPPCQGRRTIDISGCFDSGILESIAHPLSSFSYNVLFSGASACHTFVICVIRILNIKRILELLNCDGILQVSDR